MGFSTMFATPIVVPLISPTLAERVDTAIQASPHFFGRQLRFEAAGDHVVLKGSVGTYFQKQMAQETIRRVQGVKTIANDLEVSW